MHIQSILFDRSKWTLTQAYEYLHKHDIIPMKMEHLTTNFIRFRITPPNPYGKYTTKDMKNGIKIVYLI